MAFPQVVDADTQAGVQSTNSTSWSLTYPTNIAAGDLLLLFIGRDGFPGLSMAGFTFSSVAAPSNQASIGLGRKVAIGTESGSVTLTLNNTQQGAWRFIRISAATWEGTLAGGLALSAGASGSGLNPNPDLLGPGWGVADILWFAIEAADHGNTDATAWPFATAQFNDSSGGVEGAQIGTCRTESAVSSMDPGTFTIDLSEDWAALTVAVKPAAAGGQNIPVGQAAEAEAASSITPLISRTVAVGQASESETANAIIPAAARMVDVGQAVESESARGITPVIGRLVPVGQASEAETSQPITPIRGVALGQAIEVELARLVSPVKPIFVPVQTAVERELAQVVTASKVVPGQLGPAVCEVVSPSVECETFAL